MFKRSIDNINNNNNNNNNNKNNHKNTDNANDNANDNTKKLNYYYKNPLNCDEILMLDNHIYFNSIINASSVNKLIEYINIIISNIKLFRNRIVYLHINSKGGYINDLMNFIEYKKNMYTSVSGTFLPQIEIYSIIEEECVDCAILLASVCDYRFVKKKALCKLNSFNITQNGFLFPNYWCGFQQCNNNNHEVLTVQQHIYSMFCSNNNKITKDKLSIYLTRFNKWNSKKYKKLGLADEIV